MRLDGFGLFVDDSRRKRGGIDAGKGSPCEWA